MSIVLATALAAASLFVAALALMEVGRRFGLARQARHGQPGAGASHGAAEGAVLALLGLVIAFTFNGAGDRLEHRRHLISEEANAIGTVWLRLDLLDDERKASLGKLLPQYIDLRIATHHELGTTGASVEKLAQTAALQDEIWTTATDGFRKSDAAAHAPMLVLPAINAMFDIEATRVAAVLDHPPPAVFLLMVSLSLLSSLLIGYSMAEREIRSWLHMTSFAAIVSLSLFVVLELEYPRLGLVNMASADRPLIQLRSSMH